MKKITKILMAAVVLSFIGIAHVNAQSKVEKIPPVPYQKKTPSPGPRYIWIPIEWNEFKGNYVKGFWQLRPRADMEWVAGSWTKIKNGYQWNGGHWRTAKK